ncbi:MAG: DNA topoisomerase IV subunit A [Proteobacteria bacterium]|nr:DNA topoisomerase IV subunit A [Pseudomonadota bacterium]MDA1135536.1 DNA topoisomerase IV subunit A [Pseudomonadota bacterium]
MSDNDLKDDNVILTSFSQAISERYLSYALSTITSRSLPDVRDGLKPVHRRVLYAMRQLKLNYNLSYKKSARVVGDVMGKFHPHGDAAIYDSMVRMAQDFALRYPLVDGQGNFGNIDGDNAAAMRYTEARMTKAAELLLLDIDQDTVDFRVTYDDEGKEPVVLPSAFPNLLANGSQGIAVGMATSIPPHNIGELCDAIIHLIKFPNASDSTIINYVHGPDFPTGGILVESRNSIVEAYKAGKGGFRLRARWNVEKLSAGQWQIVVTEIPYQVQKSRLLEKIAELMENKHLPMLSDIRDESAEDIRLVLEPRSRNLSPEMIMETLFKKSDLETRFSLNLNVIDDKNIPGVKSLKEALQSWLNHRQIILQRKSVFRVGQIENRINILNGYITVYLNLDKVIEIIREEDKPKEILISYFSINEIQANAILDMRLRSLRKLEEIELKKELTTLQIELENLNGILNDTDKQWNIISHEIKSLKKDFGDLVNRRTSIEDIPEVDDFNENHFVLKEPITIILSEQGWVRFQKSHIDKDVELKYREGDKELFIVHALSTDKIIFFADNGRVFSVPANKLPSGRGFGEPISLTIDLKSENKIISCFPYFDGNVMIASTNGYGFKLNSANLIAQTKTGKQILIVKGEVKAKACKEITGDTVAIVGNNRKLIVFPIDDLPVLNKGKGVILQRYKDGTLSDFTSFNKNEGLSWKMNGGRKRVETDLLTWEGKRGGAGKLAPNGFPRPPIFN